MVVSLQLQVCKYYLAGHCTYGDKCRYDHKKPEWSQAAKAKKQVAFFLLNFTFVASTKLEVGNLKLACSG